MIIGDYSVHCLLAENVRDEPGNRSTIIGTYNRRANLPALLQPIALPISAFVMIQPAPPSGTKVSLKAGLNDLVFADIPVSTPEDKPDPLSAVHIGVNFSQVPISDNDRFFVSIAIDDLPETVIAQTEFKFADPTTVS